MIILVSIATFFAAVFGGLFALRFKDKLHLVLGLSAGAMIGVAFFDLIPEAVELSSGLHEISYVMMFVAIGFAFYFILDRLAVLHSHLEDEQGQHSNRATLGVGSIFFHSFLDGAIVGLAFQVSIAASMVVAVAVITHRFSDGINTVGIILKNGGARKEALMWLAGTAIAPVLGVLSSFIISLPEPVLAPMLSVFAGFFLYIGASDLLPESHHRHPTFLTTVATIVGLIVIYTIVYFVHI